MPEGQKAGPKGRQLEVGAQRAPRLLVCHICSHICIIFVILFMAHRKVLMARTKFFYTILIHPRGQLWAEFLQTLRAFSGKKWRF